MTPTAYSWTGASVHPGFEWSDADNWAPTGIPGAVDTASFAGGTLTCNIDSGVSVAGLSVGSSWSGAVNVNSPLTISGDLVLDFHPATGTFGGDGAITIGGSNSRWDSGVVTVGAGGFANNGTLAIDTGASGIYVNGTGTFTNSGTINEMGSDNLRLANFSSVTLNNQGAYHLTSDCGILGFQGTTFVNTSTGKIAKTGGTGSSVLSAETLHNLGGTLQATTGSLGLAGTSVLVDGATMAAGAGAAVRLSTGSAATYQGTINGSGAGHIVLDSGTLVVGSSGVTFNTPVANLFQWTSGAVIDVSHGSFTNVLGSTVNVDTSVASALLTGAGSLINNGTMNETGGDGLVLANGAALTNHKFYNLKSDAGIAISGSGTVNNSGTLKKVSGTGSSTIAATLNNTGTVMVSSGTVHVSGAVAQITNSTLNAGKWTVSVSGTHHGTLTIDTPFTTIGSHAVVTLNGANAVFSNLSSLASILSGGSLLLQGTASLATPGDFTNNGKLTVNAGSVLTVNGTFVETSTATLTVQLKQPNLFGQIVTSASGGGASLAGKLLLTVSGTPDLNRPFAIIDDLSSTAIAGMFANLAEGSTLTVGGHDYQIHYLSSTITLTRTN